MKRKERYIVRPDEVTITREGDYAIIQYKEDGVMTTHLKLGPVWQAAYQACGLGHADRVCAG